MTQYDSLAEKLGDIEKAIHFYREHVEFPSFFRALGPVEGKRVLDVGCGDGIYARLVAERGATEVVGTDSSAGMIRLAEAAEAARPLGVRYHVHDAATMPALGEFDVVVAVNVLHYAGSREALDGMCAQIASNLAPGGRLLAYVGNADCDNEAARDFGFFVDRPVGLLEGDPFTVTIHADPPASVRVHYWTAATLAGAVQAAGLTRVTWEEMTHSPVSEDDAVRLGRLLENPPGLLLSAYKE
ncbi:MULTISPECIES: class I SAM-dependent methyltransferase [Actinosynnema]|uniref:class I SAM-dependent methyltransferase n=1 Tax=Actinosynnema TaxID=40566 RepID=UPI0020A26D94|nr:class I SAM-dependent methyltransferase [Actinosynnema pretiosum]MCP2097721.1 Ubiquinone/menaquinone biosynthesis C-methylase UbiE [Actinosynnema pretiosum]